VKTDGVQIRLARIEDAGETRSEIAGADDGVLVAEEAGDEADAG
jgi:hypothetical protein